MSEMRTYACLRFKMKDSTTWLDILNAIRNSNAVKFENVNVENFKEWVDGRFIKTDKICYISSRIDVGLGSIVVSEDDDIMLDIVLLDKREGDKDYFIIPLSKLEEYRDAVLNDELWSCLVEPDCKVVQNSWYTGCDMPIFW